MINTIDSTITHVIPAYQSAAGASTVEILVTGDAWSVRKAVELITAAPLVYDALGDLINAVYGKERIDAALLEAQRAEAAACGAILARDRMAQP